MMHNLIGADGFHALQHALCGTYSLPVCQGKARVVAAALPGRAICAAATVAGILWVVLDFDKPSAHRHARVMLREWRETFLGHEDRTAERQLAAVAGPPTVPMPLPLLVAV